MVLLAFDVGRETVCDLGVFACDAESVWGCGVLACAVFGCVSEWDSESCWDCEASTNTDIRLVASGASSAALLGAEGRASG